MLMQLSQTLLHMHIFPSTHPPNHVLINEYQPHEGIMPHTDGPSYYPKTATISIGGGNVLLKFTQRRTTHHAQHVDDDSLPNNPVLQVKLSGNGSLIVFQDEAYTDYCHSIQDRLVDDFEVVTRRGNNCVNFVPDVRDEKDDMVQMTVVRGYRISLTFRHKFH
jgi:alkylated DNA repair protein alkB family protein 6